MSDGDGVQLAPDGNLRHLITLQHLSKSHISGIFADADRWMSDDQRPLAGRLFVNIFFESSTRTRVAFEAAARQLGADVVNLDRISMAGETKRESLEDTVRTVAAMGACGICLRHSESGAAVRAARAADEFGTTLINGGTGCESHPTQGLTDAYTLREIAGGEDFSGMKVAIVGDVLHSRVARSDAQILRTLGADIRLIGPPALCPLTLNEEFNAPVFDNMEEGLQDVDVVLLLRVQQERFVKSYPDASPAAYFKAFGMTGERLSHLKSSAVILHPGPINRGMEISDEVADGARSRILRQVTNGMGVRKAVLAQLCAR